MMRCLLIALIVGLCLFNLPTEAQGQFFDPTPDTVLTAAWNPQGTSIATGHTDGTIRIWGQDGEIVQTLSQHTNMINALSWNSDGSLLASSSRDLTVKIWETTNWRSIDTALTTSDDVLVLQWIGNNIYGGSATFNNSPPKSFWEWDSDGDLIRSEAMSTILNMIASPNRQEIAFSDYGRIDIIDSSSLLSQEIILSPVQSILEIASAVLWKPNGTELIAGYRNGKIRVWNANTSQTQTTPLLELQGNNGDGGDNFDNVILDLWLGSDGETLLSVSADDLVRKWNLSDPDVLLAKKQLDTSETLFAAAISPDGSQIAYGNADGVIQLMDAP